ncbi:MAG: hypothetical protein JOY54_18345 [Acidobacteriaceae bacterium]|nr:hypothetical protein [Acidobacteriaceae bacterium]
MWQQIRAISWAQFRSMRNHLPRTSVGTVLVWLFSALWYGLFTAAGVFLAIEISRAPIADLARWLPVGFLALFLYWQVVPLFTLSSGWSLQLKKLQAYPVSNRALFGIEVLLRITSSPEMILLVIGTVAGLLRHLVIPFWAAWAPLAFIPLNLFLQLGIRDFILHSFERNRFREVFAILLISIAVIPQVLVRSGLGPDAKRYLFHVSDQSAAPWHAIAFASLGHASALEALLFCGWTTLAYVFARAMFRKSLCEVDDFRPSGSSARENAAGPSRDFLAWPSAIFRDPLAALLQKEFHCLLRMPRFRVLFGMACIFSVVVFLPVTLKQDDAGAHWLNQNFLPVVNLYGLLLLSDALLLNAFGLDGGAAQIYFVTPVSLETVIKAKNLVAVAFVVVQSVTVLLVVTLIRATVTPGSIAAGLAASAVVTVFLLAVGNFTSVIGPRPVDPKQTFKKQAGARMQLWLLGCSIGMFLLVGFAFLARYAFNSDWALLAVLIFEFLIGLIMYKFATESAVAKGMRERERIVEALSKSASPVSAG